MPACSGKHEETEAAEVRAKVSANASKRQREGCGDEEATCRWRAKVTKAIAVVDASASKADHIVVR